MLWRLYVIAKWLNATDKIEQENKFTHFFLYVFDSLTIHFKQWIEDFLFLGLFSNQRMAAPIANMLIERRDTSRGEVHDGNNSWTINLRGCKDFLVENVANVTIMKERNLLVVKTTI